MLVRLEDPGKKKIAVIKEIRTYYGFSLKEAKEWSDKAPVKLPPIEPDNGVRLVSALRSVGATVTAMNPSALDKMAAVSFIHAAEEALGNNDLDGVRHALRSALTLVGDV